MNRAQFKPAEIVRLRPVVSAQSVGNGPGRPPGPLRTSQDLGVRLDLV